MEILPVGKSHFAVSSAQFDELFAKFKKFDENSSQFDENIAKFIKFADFARNCDGFTSKCDEMFSITDCLFLKSFICDAKIKWGHKEGIRLNIQKMSGEHFNDGCIYIIVRTVSVFERAGS